MAKQIDIDLVKAEIERLREIAHLPQNKYRYGFVSGWLTAFQRLSEFLDTLQEQEVDLEKEFSKWWKKEHSHNYEVDILYERYSNISLKLASHFYELGRAAK